MLYSRKIPEKISINQSHIQSKIDNIPDKPSQNIQILNELSENLEKKQNPIQLIQNDPLKRKKIEKKIDNEIKDIARSMVMSEYRQSLDTKLRENKRFSEILLKSQEKHNLNDINHIHPQSISSVPLTTTRENKS